MAYTVADVLTFLARRLGENSSPDSANEKARRISYIDEGYKDLVTSDYFWFTQATTQFNSVANQEEYTTSDGFPTDYRDMVELRVDNILYTAIPESKITGLYNSTINVFNYDNLLTDKHYYVFANTLHILPKTPANGTNNIKMKYYKFPTPLTSSTNTFLLPDFFVNALVAYAYGRKGQLSGDRAKAQDGFTEYEAIKKQIITENNRRKFYGKSSRTIEPSYVVD